MDLVELVDANGSLCRAELMPLFSFLDMAVWCGVEWGYAEELASVDTEQGELITQTKAEAQDPNTFTPKYDKKGTYKAVADEYRLGDVLFFKSIGPARMTHYGDSEIHLGNEGFWGTIYEQVAVIATL